LIVVKAQEFKENREKYTEEVIFTKGVLEPMNWLPSGSWEAKVEQADVFKARSNRAYESIVTNGLILSSGALLLILVTLILFVRKILIWRYMGFTLLFISIVALVVGVSTPMMEIAFFSTDMTIPIDAAAAKEYVPNVGGILDLIKFDITFDGRMYYLYQSKSILGLIGILLSEGNIPVGLAIMIFSILLPIVKLLCSFGQLLSPAIAKSKGVYFITNRMGKWSMADVFVVSVFLAYFSIANMNAGVESQSIALFGLYCFGGYVILSLLASMFINAAIKRESGMDHKKAISDMISTGVQSTMGID
jgi:hypothetical protein